MNAPANRALAQVSQTIHAVAPTFNAVLANKSMNFEREAGFALQIIGASDYAQKIAMSNPQSLVNSVTNLAAIGITLNPARKLAYLVPRKGGICLDISYMGLMDIAIESGCLSWGQARLVHEKDTFVLNGLDKEPTHQFAPFDNDRGRVIGAYCVVKLPGGDFLTECMTIEEIEAVRDRSDAWKAYIKDKRTCPWVTDPGEMQKKTVVKRAYKYWPKNERMAQAVHYVNTDGGEGIELVQQVAPSTAEPSLLAAAQAAADKGRAAFGTFWKGCTPAQREELRADVDALRDRCTTADVGRTIDMPPAQPRQAAPSKPAGRAPAADPFVAAMERAEAEQRAAA